MRAATCHRQVGRASPLKGHGSLWLAATQHRCKWRGRLRAMSRSDEPFYPPPWWRGGWRRAQGRIGPDGRSSRDGTGCPFTAAPSTSPAAGTPDRQRRAGAPPRGVLSLVPFSGQAEKGTRARRVAAFGSTKVTGRGTPEHPAINRGAVERSHTASPQRGTARHSGQSSSGYAEAVSRNGSTTPSRAGARLSVLKSTQRRISTLPSKFSASAVQDSTQSPQFM